MKIHIEITDIEKTVKLIEKINSLTAELKNAVYELQDCSTRGIFELKANQED